MSAQMELPGFGSVGPVVSQQGREAYRASIQRELVYLLTIVTNASGRYRISPAGVVHSIGVALIEDYNVARGKGRGEKQTGNAAMPRFVDVKLTAEQKSEFVDTDWTPAELVAGLQALSDDGYRVGCSWNSEGQSYIVSLTCRNPESPNNGLCMTSYAKTVERAIALALFKHRYVTKEDWTNGVGSDDEDFG